MNTSCASVRIFAGALVVASASLAQAALITPIGVTSPNNVDGSALLANMINHNGLDATTLQHASAFATQNHWRTTSPANAVQLTFDLGAVFKLDGSQIWNYNESGTGGGGALNTNRGFQNFNISFSTDNVTFSNTQSISLNQATGLATYAGEFDAFNQPVDARFVRINNVTSYGSNNGFTGLSEVRFNTINEILTPTVSVNQVANGGGSFGIENIVNGDGMTGAGKELSVPASGANGFDGQWRQNQPANGNSLTNSEITFDFGVATDIGIVKIWNYSETGTIGAVATTTRGLSQVELFESNDGVIFTSLGVFNLTQGVQVNSTLHNVIDLTGLHVNARFIRIDANSIFDPNNGFYGLGEVRFFAATIPEPTTMALGLLGLAGLATRRRRLA